MPVSHHIDIAFPHPPLFCLTEGTSLHVSFHELVQKYKTDKDHQNTINKTLEIQKNEHRIIEPRVSERLGCTQMFTPQNNCHYYDQI